ncbi:MAG: site-specific DNA-methyltransferase [Spirosomaceae bacterium]|jgi:DNA modification methylase|nr:site-specific DNA-methyltransferase [Spirosomataceae bacterium]
MMEVNKIYLGDCIKGMQKLENGSVDLIIADPPYNLNKDFGNSSDKWDDVNEWVKWSKLWLDVAIKKLKPTGSIFVYGIHHYLCFLQVHLYEKNLKYRRQIIWHYENSFSGYKNAPSANYEPILWFSKSDTYTYHQIREPYKSTERLKNKIIKNGKVWTPNPDGKHAGDVWNIPVLAGKRFAEEKVEHPTQKPIAICDRIVQHFSNEGDLVLIPFAGSGSECVSALSNGRNFIAFEKNKNYIEIANNRIVQVRKQPEFQNDKVTNGIFAEM